MINHSLKSCENLIDKYINKYKGELFQIEEGVLGLGKVLLHNGDNAKTIVINEFFLTPWSSGHTVRKYNKMPEKYRKLIEV